MKQRKAIKTLTRDAMRMANQGLMEQAHDLMDQVERLSIGLGSPLLLSLAKNNLGIIHQMEGSLDRAKTLFVSGLGIATRTRGPEHPLAKAIQRNLDRLPSHAAKAA